MSRATKPSPLTVPVQASRSWRARLVIGAVLGAVGGAAVGAVAFNALGTDSTATAMVRLTPPAELTAIAAGAERATPDTDTYINQYVTGEVAYLSGVGFARAVGENLGQSEPAEVEILQEMGSSVIVFTAHADSDEEATRNVQAAIDVYREQLAERSAGQLEAILPAVEEWEVAAAASGDVFRARQVQALREAIRLEAATPASLSVLQSPAVEEAVGSQAALGAALGALVGGAAVPLRQMARRRKSGSLVSLDAIGEHVDGVIVPAVDLRHATHAHSSSQAALARTLYAQCTSSGPARTIVVIGASAASGSAVVAALLQQAAAEIGPAELITLTGQSTLSSGSGGTVVVDCGAVGDSPRLGEAIRQATDLIVVAKLGVDTVDRVFMVRSATAAGEVPLVAVTTYSPWRR